MAQTCPTCGTRNDETAAKCVSCGAPLPLISDPSTLQESWEASKLRKELRSAGVWSLLWGLFAIVTGVATLEASGLNAVLVAIGLFLIGTGIAAWRAPGPTTAALDAAALLAVGVWNIGITLFGGESTERFWAIAGVVQIVWAVQRFARRARFARLQHVPEAAIERAARLVADAQKARLAQVADVIEFRAGGKRWRARLAPDVIALVTGNGREVRFLSPEQFDLTAQGPGTGVIRATVRAGAERWDGSLSSTMWDRYQAWVERASPPEPVAAETPGAEAAAALAAAAELPMATGAGEEEPVRAAAEEAPAATPAATRPPAGPAPRVHWPLGMGLLNLTGLGLGYLTMRRWLRWVLHVVVTVILLLAARGHAVDPTATLWLGPLALWVLWMAVDGWRLARRGVREAGSPQLRRSWVPVAVAVLVLALELGGVLGYRSLGYRAYVRGWTAYAMGDVERASEHLERALQTYAFPGASYAEEAEAQWRECTRLTVADGLCDEGKYEEAIDHYQAHLEDYPDGAFASYATEGVYEAYAGWSRGLSAEGSYLQALETLGQAHDLAKDDGPNAVLEEAYAEAFAGLSEDTGPDGQSVMEENWVQVCAGLPALSPAIAASEDADKAWTGEKQLRIPEDAIADRPGAFRFAVCLREDDKVVQRCGYMPSGTVIRQQRRWTVRVRDVLTGRAIGSELFEGDVPGKCPQVQTFVGKSRTVNKYGSRPDAEAIAAWVGGVLDAEPQLADVARPTPSLRDTEAVPTPAAMEAPVDLTVVHGWRDAEEDALEALVGLYENLHPNARIELIRVDERNVLTAMFAAGEPADVISWSSDNVPEWAEKGLVAPLDAYVDEAWVRERYLASAADLVIEDGHVYGLPHRLGTVALIYNRALISEDELPQTTDELLEQAATWSGSDPYFVCDTSLAYFSGAWFHGGGAWFVDDACQANLDHPAGVAGAELIASFREIMPRVTVGEVTTMFEEGDAAMVVNGSWSLSSLTDSGVDHGVAVLPTIGATGARAAPFVHVDAFYLGVGAVERGTDAAAVALIQFLASPESQVTLAQEVRMLPTSREAASDPRVQEDEAIVQFLRQVEHGTPVPPARCFGVALGEVDDLLDDLWDEDADPTEAVSAAQAQLEARLGEIE